MSAPYAGLSSNPNATVVVQPPPNQDSAVQQVVTILLLGYAVEKTAAMLAAVFPDIPHEIWSELISATGGMSGHRAYARLQVFEIDQNSVGAEVARSVARKEIFYRAAYLLNAAHRVEKDTRGGENLQEAVRDELPNFRLHEAARAARLQNAVGIAWRSNRFGRLLGWYLNPLLDNERECITASGHNFYADEGTVIGYPGAVHPRCGCNAGPPIAGAGLVNDALAADRAVIFGKPRRYRLRQKAS